MMEQNYRKLTIIGNNILKQSSLMRTQYLRDLFLINFAFQITRKITPANISFNQININILESLQSQAGFEICP